MSSSRPIPEFAYQAANWVEVWIRDEDPDRRLLSGIKTSYTVEKITLVDASWMVTQEGQTWNRVPMEVGSVEVPSDRIELVTHVPTGVVVTSE